MNRMRFPSNLKFVVPLLTLFISGCSKEERKDRARTDAENTGYLIGVDIAARLKNQPLPIDLRSVLAGIEDYYLDRQLRVPMDSLQKLQQRMEKLGRDIEKDMARNRDQALAFLDSNAKQPDVRKVAGIQFSILKPGEGGETPSDSDNVICNLSCTLLNGTVIKDTWKSKSPERFEVAKTLPGLAKVLKTMTKGSRLKVWVPPEAAYGREGVRGSIPAYSLLVYEIELLEII